MLSNATSKFYCEADDHVAQFRGRLGPRCPFCQQPMICMGPRWRPGKKGSRTRLWDRKLGPGESWTLRELKDRPVKRAGRKSRRAAVQAALTAGPPPKHPYPWYLKKK